MNSPFPNDSALPIRLPISKEILLESVNSSGHILHGVDIEPVWELLQHCPFRELSPNHCLLEKSQVSKVMFVVLTGKLKAFLREGKEGEIAQFETGHTVGELSVIDGAPASAFVIAEETSAVLEIDTDTYWRLAHASHQFCSNMMMLLAARLRSNNYSLTEYKRLQLKFQHDSMVDGLTGLYNRRWLDNKLKSLVARAKRDHFPLALMILDIDHFKRFNDEFGHKAGDCVIQAVAKSFSNNVRPLDLSARYGGEEFCILLPYTNIAGGKNAAERIRRLVSNTLVLDEDTELPNVTVSIGVACLQPDEADSMLITRADKALYQAKENGRNQVVVA